MDVRQQGSDGERNQKQGNDIRCHAQEIKDKVINRPHGLKIIQQ